MNMLPVKLRHDGEQKQEAPEFDNQTRTDPGNRGAVPLRRAVREEEDTRRVHQGDGVSSKACHPRTEADQRELLGGAAALMHFTTRQSRAR
jgi:hypothetical protein